MNHCQVVNNSHFILQTNRILELEHTGAFYLHIVGCEEDPPLYDPGEWWPGLLYLGQ